MPLSVSIFLYAHNENDEMTNPVLVAMQQTHETVEPEKVVYEALGDVSSPPTFENVEPVAYRVQKAYSNKLYPEHARVVNQVHKQAVRLQEALDRVQSLHEELQLVQEAYKQLEMRCSKESMRSASADKAYEELLILRKRCEQEDRENKTLRDQLERYAHQCTRDEEVHKHNIETHMNDIQRLKARQDELMRLINGHEQTVVAKNTEIEKLLKQLEAAEKKEKRYLQEGEKLSGELDLFRLQKEQEVAAIRQQNEQLMLDIGQMEQDSAQRLNRLRNELQAAKKELKAVKKSQKNPRKNSEEEIRQLREQLEEKNIEIGRLQDVQEQNVALMSEIHVLRLRLHANA